MTCATQDQRVFSQERLALKKELSRIDRNQPTTLDLGRTGEVCQDHLASGFRNWRRTYRLAGSRARSLNKSYRCVAPRVLT